MATMYVNYGSFESWASKIRNSNETLRNYLEEIRKTITSLESTHISDSAITTREKINGMQSIFNQYYDVVDTYARFVRNTGESYRAIEDILNDSANQFIQRK